ncbi:hypothetical protein [Streptococcus pyogenes]|uniref:hypothetical protein n=1 Tax=Streptococcus pyogenes TaxID=1314 RepID=UPI001574ABC7|nr:hypothetical protein [Streptococcus pyogenes]NSX78836.1 hypothetical protein [Streptococcus pyogenes]NTS61523.1 hypothetical protein [Streptococcus pyogenes]
MEQIKITGTGTALILDRVNRIFAISGSLTMQWDFISDFKKAMKAQSKEKALEYCGKTVKDDEADAILIGSYYVNQGYLDGLETHDYY